MNKESKNIAIEAGKNFYTGVRQVLTDRDMIATAFVVSGLRGIITRDSNEMLRGFCAGMTVGAVYNGVANVITGGLLTEDEEM